MKTTGIVRGIDSLGRIVLPKEPVSYTHLTDQGRYVEGAVDVIYNTLRETGLLWDEGPDIGGPVGPYVQSERMGMFKQYAEQLVAEGKAYYLSLIHISRPSRRSARQGGQGLCQHRHPREGRQDLRSAQACLLYTSRSVWKPSTPSSAPTVR